MKVEEGDTGPDHYSRDLLWSFSLCDGRGVASGVAEKLGYKSPSEDTEELELGLGLSLGGRFGIEKSSKQLVRSASVAGALPFTREEDLGSIAGPSGYFPSIIRTSSLPTEAEDEFRKRKEWQSLRRLEAKRRRCEKQRRGRGESDCVDEIEGQSTKNLVDKHKVLGNGRVPVTPLPSVVPGLGAISGQGLIGVGGVGEVASKGKEGMLGLDGYGLVGLGMAGSRGSRLEAQRGSSSGSGGGSDSDGRLTHGSSTSNETKSLSPERVSLATKPPTGKPKKGARDIFPGRDAPEIKPMVQSVSSTEDNMPGVFTKGDGPNGIRVDGILYKYGKGEEVRIMCVCHGKFLSPAEFVRHAGGGDVANPRRHIFINTSTLL